MSEINKVVRGHLAGGNERTPQKMPELDLAIHGRTATSSGAGLWHRILNPFHIALRITEYLAGPPVHEEISSLQEESQKWRRRTAALEVERDQLQQRATNLERDRERLAESVTNLTKERDELKKGNAALETICNDVKQSAGTVEKAQESILVHNANSRMHLPIVSIHEADSDNVKSRLNNLRESLQMSAGTFALLNEEGDDSGYSWNLLHHVQRNGQNAQSIFETAQKAAYDPLSDQVLFCGGPNGSSQPNTLLRYDIGSNKWWAQPAPDTWGKGCAYDTNTLNSSGRELYVSSMLRSNSLRRLQLDTNTWCSMDQPDSIGFTPSEASAEYFPERDELLWLQTKRLGAWKRSSNTWRLISPALQGLRWRSAIARYNSVLQCVLILGGGDMDKTMPIFSHAVYRYERNGTITRMKDSPPSVNIYIDRAVVTVDPVGGDFLIIQAVHDATTNDFTGEIEFWKYRMDTDTWTTLDASVIPPSSMWWPEKYPSGIVAVPLSKYGVILFMSASPESKSRVYVYRHI